MKAHPKFIDALNTLFALTGCYTPLVKVWRDAGCPVAEESEDDDAETWRSLAEWRGRQMVSISTDLAAANARIKELEHGPMWHGPCWEHEVGIHNQALERAAMEFEMPGHANRLTHIGVEIATIIRRLKKEVR